MIEEIKRGVNALNGLISFLPGGILHERIRKTGGVNALNGLISFLPWQKGENMREILEVSMP